MPRAGAPRRSRQRDLVRRLLGQLDEFASAQQIHALLGRRGSRMGLATVYRILRYFAESGDVSVVYGRGHEARYRWCGTQRHAHLVCRRCFRAVEVPESALVTHAVDLARQYDFLEVDSTVEVLGTCRDCVVLERAGGSARTSGEAR